MVISAIEKRQGREVVTARWEWRNTVLYRVVRKSLSERWHLSQELKEIGSKGCRWSARAFKGPGVEV